MSQLDNAVYNNEQYNADDEGENENENDDEDEGEDDDEESLSSKPETTVSADNNRASSISKSLTTTYKRKSAASGEVTLYPDIPLLTT